MKRVVVDQELLNKLSQLAEPLVLCDEKGRMLGHVLPVVKAEDLPPGSLREPPFSPEEMERRHNEKGGSTLAEIWKRLGRT